MLKHIILFGCVSFLGCAVLQAQENPKIKKSEFRVSKGDAFDAAWKAVKEGNSSYKDGKYVYPEARKFFLEAVKYNDKNAELNYKLGITYLFTDNKAKALPYLLHAFELKNNVTADIQYWIARAYHYDLQFDKAIEFYKKFNSTATEKLLNKIDKNIQRRIEECENGKVLVANPVKATIINLGEAVNSEYDDYHGLPINNGSLLSFTTRRPDDDNSRESKYDKKYYERIYVSTIDKLKYSNAIPIGQPFDDRKDIDLLAENSRGTLRFFYLGNKGGGDIYYSSLKNSEWSDLRAIKGDVRSDFPESSITISPDGKEVLVVADRHENKKYKNTVSKDIYRADVLDKNRFTCDNFKIESGDINSPYDEDAVFLHSDGKTLYFSSKGFNSMGGYDVFKSVRDKNGFWSKPENLGYPINTPDDDMYFWIDAKQRVGYISANREDTKGLFDIYRVVMGTNKEVELSLPVPVPVYLASYPTSLLKEPVNSVTVGLPIKGVILDAATNKPLAARIQIINQATTEVLGSVLTDSTGVYQFVVNEPKAYGFEVSALNHLFLLEIVDFSKLPVSDEYQRDFKLSPVVVGAKMVLKNIFFETGKAVIKAESYPELARVVQLMRENTNLKLEISGHTDNVGKPASNQKLSLARAQAVVDYLVQQGVDKSHFTAVGYGSKQPVAPNKTKAGRDLNRRVEFKVLGN